LSQQLRWTYFIRILPPLAAKLGRCDTQRAESPAQGSVGVFCIQNRLCNVGNTHRQASAAQAVFHPEYGLKNTPMLPLRAERPIDNLLSPFQGYGYAHRLGSLCYIKTGDQL
jgi:hypothetical protein